MYTELLCYDLIMGKWKRMWQQAFFKGTPLKDAGLPFARGSSSIASQRQGALTHLSGCFQSKILYRGEHHHVCMESSILQAKADPAPAPVTW